MEKRRFSLIIPLLCCLLQIQAQWDNLPAQYRAASGYFNPAFAGETDAIRTRYVWNAPRQILFTADAPFEWLQKRHGAGLVAFTETVGELRNSLLAAQYSFKKETDKGFLHIGLQAGTYALNFDAGSSHKVFDLNAGVSWTGKSFVAGLSAMHLNQPRFSVRDSTLSHIPRTYNLMAGYNIAFFRPLEMQPEVCVLTDLSSLQVQASLRLEYDKRFSGGASWRRNDGYVFFAGAVVREAELGYAYGLHSGGKGSHELYLRYSFPLDHFKPKRYPRKSIRLL